MKNLDEIKLENQCVVIDQDQAALNLEPISVSYQSPLVTNDLPQSDAFLNLVINPWNGGC